MPGPAPSSLALLALLGAPQEVARTAVDPATGHGYLRTDEPMSVYDADALARTLGGRLVAINSAEEETFLLENFGASELYWIGLEFPHRTWASGEPVTFAHWFPGEPASTPLEPFTLMNWDQPGAWIDVPGHAVNEHHRALIELPGAPPEGALPAVPDARRPAHGVLLCAIQGLTQRDLENPRNPALNGLWKASAWTADAAADGSGDPLAGLGMVVWGVGSVRSQLASRAPAHADRTRNRNLLSRLEEALPEVTTVALLDDPALAGILLDGPVDVRLSNASPRHGGEAAAAHEALALPTPLCAVAAWTTAETTGGEPLAEAERAKDVAAIDAELGALLAALRARPRFAEERWWIAVCGIAPVKDKKTKPDDLRARTAVPLALVGGPLAPGPVLATVNLPDLTASALQHLGVEPRSSFALDGVSLARPLELGRNLVVNGDAEAQLDWPAAGFPQIRGWRQLASFRPGRYGGDPGPPEHGESYFQGMASPLASMEQTIDLSALEETIGRGNLRYSLAGWLGTTRPVEATLGLALEFLSEQGKVVEDVELGPVGGVDKKTKEAVPAPPEELVAEGRVPRRARAVRLVLTARGEEGIKRTLADRLRLVLTAE